MIAASSLLDIGVSVLTAALIPPMIITVVSYVRHLHSGVAQFGSASGS